MSLFDIFKPKKVIPLPPPTGPMPIAEKAAQMCRNAGVPFSATDTVLFCSEKYPVVVVNNNLIHCFPDANNDPVYEAIPLGDIDWDGRMETPDMRDGAYRMQFWFTPYNLFEIDPMEADWLCEAVHKNHVSCEEARRIGTERRIEKIAKYSGFAPGAENPVYFVSRGAVGEHFAPPAAVYAHNIISWTNGGEAFSIDPRGVTNLSFDASYEGDYPQFTFTLADGTEVTVGIWHTCEQNDFVNAVDRAIRESQAE